MVAGDQPRALPRLPVPVRQDAGTSLLAPAPTPRLARSPEGAADLLCPNSLQQQISQPNSLPTERPIMLRSLYSGISGLRSHQTMLDVTGNNIANVNTTGFKASSVQFQDTLSQLTQGAAGPQAADRRHQPGPGRPRRAGGRHLHQLHPGLLAGHRPATDMMISGDGFFVTSKGGEAALHPRRRLRPGRAAGRLVTPDGAILQGWAADATGDVSTGGPVSEQWRSPLSSWLRRRRHEGDLGGNLPGEANSPPHRWSADVQVVRHALETVPGHDAYLYGPRTAADVGGHRRRRNGGTGTWASRSRTAS